MEAGHTLREQLAVAGEADVDLRAADIHKRIIIDGALQSNVIDEYFG